VLIAFISRNDLLERLDPAEEPLKSTAFLVEVWIKPKWPRAPRMLPISGIHRNITSDSLFPVVLADLPGIVGWIWEMVKGCSKAPGISNASIVGS
jgi:hypothetical protein